MGDMVKKDRQSIPEIFQGMITPEEKIKRVTVKTTVQTDQSIHKVWHTSDGKNEAIFKHTTPAKKK